MSLLNDLWQQLQAENYCVPAWQQLFAQWLACEDGAQRQDLLQAIAASALADPAAECLRLGFLHDATGDMQFSIRLSECLQAWPAASAERLAAFMAYRWGMGLKQQQDSARFISNLQQHGLPVLSARLAAMAEVFLPENLPKRAARETERVAIVAPYLASAIHTPSAMVVNQCKLLLEAGKTVKVFSAQELKVPQEGWFNSSAYGLRLPALDLAYWQSALPKGAGMVVSDSRFSLQRRWQEMMQHIAEFDPDVVYLCGLYSPLAAALYTRRPVLALNVHAMPSISPADVWLSADEHAPASSPWEPVYPLPVTRFHPYRVKRQPVIKALSRLDLGLDHDALVWITVGFRLAEEITGEWAERCVQLIRQQPQIVWLLVGVDTVPPALQHLPADNIRVLGGRKDVSAVLQLADIYVNPPRMGGGYSVAEAMAESLPVVSLADSDGGRKLGANAARDETAYFQLLSALCADVNLRKQQGTVLQQRFASQLDLAAAGPELCAALDQAASIASQRLQIKN